MWDAVLIATLPYAAMSGIVVSGLASIVLVVGTFLKTQRLNSEIIPRLAELDASIKRSASRIEAQVAPMPVAAEPVQTRVIVENLYDIATDLQSEAGEVHRLLDQINKQTNRSGSSDERGRVLDLGQAVLRTESYLTAVMQKLELQKNELAATRSARAIDKG